MPDTKISALTAVVTPDVSDVLPIVSGGATKKIAVADLLADAGGVLIAADPVTLTNAQIKALPTTPVEIVPSPGAAKVAVGMFVVVDANFSAGAYSNIGADSYMILGTPDENNVSWLLANVTGDTTLLTYFFSANHNLWFQTANQGYTPNDGTQPRNLGDVSAIPNTPLHLLVLGNTGNLTGGNAANTLTVSVYYIVIDV